MDKDLKLDLLRVFVKHDVLPETAVRNEEIIIKYKELRESGITGKEARHKLAEEYFTSIKNIEFILYGKRKNDK
ncbi:MAG: hypothetical protein KKB34_04975 [Bacteroidetes bacterium]|nr:hypothetical protein [Bacteroidota bacterium]